MAKFYRRTGEEASIFTTRTSPTLDIPFGSTRFIATQFRHHDFRPAKKEKL